MAEKRDRDGRIPLHYAAAANAAAELKRLIEAGSDPSAADRRGWTPLHFAAQNFAIDASAALLDARAEVIAPDAHGNTPLGVATFNSRGRGEIITMLRARGADPYWVNNAGRTPVYLARLIGSYNIHLFFDDLP
ncbi:MAG: ankyrin repeat domain-containing protein [Chloroflexota bacterium]